jgi:hypothetical protein
VCNEAPRVWNIDNESKISNWTNIVISILMRRVICRKTYFCFPFVPIDRFTCLSPADGVMVKSRMRVLVCVCVLGGGITFDSTPDIAFEFQVRVYIYYSPGRSGGRPIIPFSQSFFFSFFPTALVCRVQIILTIVLRPVWLIWIIA